MPKQSFNYALFLFAYYAHVGTFATYASLFFAARGMTAPQVGILMSLAQVMRIVGPNLWGWVADHTRRRVRVLRWTALAASVTFLGIFLGENFFQFAVAMVLLNLFSSAQGPLGEALMLAEMKGDLTHYGRLRLWGSIGFIVAVMGAAWALDRFGIEALPSIAGALLLCVLGASLRIREAPPAPAPAKAPSLLKVLRQRAVIAFFASTALMIAAHSSLYVFYSLYLERIGYSKIVIGAMWSIGVLAEVVFFYYQAPVFRRFGAPRLMMLAFFVGIARFALIGGAAQSLALLVLAQLLHAATFAVHHSACMITMQRWFAGPLQARGQALFMSIAYGIGGTLGALFMSLCWDQVSPDAVYFAAAALCALAAVAARRSFQALGQA